MEKEGIHETKPSHQGTSVIFLNSNGILKTFLTEVSWLHLTTPACVHKKPYPARKNDDDVGLGAERKVASWMKKIINNCVYLLLIIIKMETDRIT